MNFPKYFTPYEANQMLPFVKKIVDEILKRGQELKTLVAAGPQPAMEQRSHALVAEIEELMAEIETLGCFFKDWNFQIGLVDFPAVIEGEEVFLCWRSDEKDLRWYHAIDDGYVSRRPIPEHWLIEVDWENGRHAP